MMIPKIRKMIVRVYSILLYATLALLILACDTTDKTKVGYDTSGKAADKSINSQTKQVNQTEEVEPWSYKVLWDSFSKTKSSASFSFKPSEQLPVYDFKIVGKLKDDGYFLPQYVEVKSNGKIIQKLRALDRFDNHREGWDAEWGSIVEVVDINFDGYLDLRLLYNMGVTGNDWYATYLFNPITGKFVFNDKLSQLSGITTNESEQIITYNRGGSCAEYREYYKWVRNKLVLLKAEWTEIDRNRDEEVNGFGCFMYTGIPRHANVKIDPDRMINYDGNEASYIRKRMKDIKEKPLPGNLDGR